MRYPRILAGLGLMAALAGSTALSLTATEPVPTRGFSLLGHSLTASNRDFRVNNNFTDSPGEQQHHAAGRPSRPHRRRHGHLEGALGVGERPARYGRR